jgi:hypothetical protein
VPLPNTVRKRTNGFVAVGEVLVDLDADLERGELDEPRELLREHLVDRDAAAQAGVAEVIGAAHERRAREQVAEALLVAARVVDAVAAGRVGVLVDLPRADAREAVEDEQLRRVRRQRIEDEARARRQHRAVADVEVRPRLRQTPVRVQHPVGRVHDDEALLGDRHRLGLVIEALQAVDERHGGRGDADVAKEATARDKMLLLHMRRHGFVLTARR